MYGQNNSRREATCDRQLRQVVLTTINSLKYQHFT